VLGAIILAVIIVIMIPVGVLMSGAAGAAVLGIFLRADADARHPDSELRDLNT
jgi:hypothetical protein